MKFLKLALTMAMLWIAAATYANAQGIRQTTSNVSKAKTSSKVEKNAEPQYYELRCRGGVTYQTDSTYHLPVPQKLDFSITEGRAVANQRMMNMLVNFIPGTERVAPTGSNLEEGQCSWLDRGFRPEEPAQLRPEVAFFRKVK